MPGAGPSVPTGAARLRASRSQAGFGDQEFYPEFVDKAAVLTVRIARNHPLPDGNKRLAWHALTMFCALNEIALTVAPDEAVGMMVAIAAGELDEGAVATWLSPRLHGGWIKGRGE